jgi:hypothetical protein
VQATEEAVLDAAKEGNLGALTKLLGEDPALLNCIDEVRIARAWGLRAWPSYR